MGQKANPTGLRLKIVKDWDGSWFSTKDYHVLVKEDYDIRSFITQELSKAGISKILIDRKASSTIVRVFVAKTGLIFGKRGPDIDFVKEALSKLIKKPIAIQVIEEKNVDTNSKLIAEWIAQQLEKRVAFRRAMKMAVQKSMKAGALGIKINCSGRLGGVEIARSEWYREGKVPLHTLRADIDYAFSESLTTYGKIGVKVWIYMGEIFDKNSYLNNKYNDSVELAN
jgi:small subunit ribosomal protein S3